MQGVIEGLVRMIGWAVLKAVTLGRYTSSGQSDRMVEGTIGLLLIAGSLWAVYTWWPV